MEGARSLTRMLKKRKWSKKEKKKSKICKKKNDYKMKKERYPAVSCVHPAVRINFFKLHICSPPFLHFYGLLVLFGNPYYIPCNKNGD